MRIFKERKKVGPFIVRLLRLELRKLKVAVGFWTLGGRHFRIVSPRYRFYLPCIRVPRGSFGSVPGPDFEIDIWQLSFASKRKALG